LGPELPTLMGQLFPQFDIVIDFSVEHQLKPAVIGSKRLVAIPGEIDYSQPSMPYYAMTIIKDAFIIGSPVPLDEIHFTHPIKVVGSYPL